MASRRSRPRWLDQQPGRAGTQQIGAQVAAEAEERLGQGVPRLGLWFGGRVEIQGTGAYVPTTLKLTEGTQNVTTADAKLSLFVNGGVGVISRGGVAFTAQATTTNVTGVVGGGAAINLGGLSLTAGPDLLAYSAGYQGAGQTSESGWGFRSEAVEAKTWQSERREATV